MALLELLLKKDNYAYISFYNALVREAYDDLANLLYDDLPKMSQNAHKSNSDSNTSYGEKRRKCRFVGCVDMCYLTFDMFNI